MRMRVMRSGRAVGGPARVGDAGEAREQGLVDLRFEIGDARSAARTLQFAVHMQGDAAGVVTAVFEAFEAFQQNGGDIALRDGADDATHGSSFFGLAGINSS